MIKSEKEKYQIRAVIFTCRISKFFILQILIKHIYTCIHIQIHTYIHIYLPLELKENYSFSFYAVVHSLKYTAKVTISLPNKVILGGM